VGVSANFSDGQTSQQRDGYNYRHSNFVNNDNSSEGNDREMKLANESVEQSTINDEDHSDYDKEKQTQRKKTEKPQKNN